MVNHVLQAAFGSVKKQLLCPLGKVNCSLLLCLKASCPIHVQKNRQPNKGGGGVGEKS